MPVDPQAVGDPCLSGVQGGRGVGSARFRDVRHAGGAHREKFRDATPEVSEGLKCASCRRVYPIVSDIPVMLIDEALPAEG